MTSDSIGPENISENIFNFEFYFVHLASQKSDALFWSND